MSTNYYAKRVFPLSFVEKINECVHRSDGYTLRKVIEEYLDKDYSAIAIISYTHMPIEFHLGKKSCGWKFLWQVNFLKDGSSYKSLLPFDKAGIVEWFKNNPEYSIFDEYDKEVSLEDFLTLAFDDNGYTANTYDSGDNYYDYICEGRVNMIRDLGFEPSKMSDTEFENDNLRFSIGDFC